LRRSLQTGSSFIADSSFNIALETR
jgi:hypothetical protein